VQFCIKVWSCWQRTKTWHVFWHIFTLFLSPSSRKRSETDCLTLAHTGTRFNPDPRREAGLAVLGVSRNSTGVSLVQFSNLSAASATANDCNGGGLILGWHRHRTRFGMKVKGNKRKHKEVHQVKYGSMDRWMNVETWIDLIHLDTMICIIKLGSPPKQWVLSPQVHLHDFATYQASQYLGHRMWCTEWPGWGSSFHEELKQNKGLKMLEIILWHNYTFLKDTLTQSEQILALTTSSI
jgi:hypothetical protein